MTLSQPLPLALGLAWAVLGILLSPLVGRAIALLPSRHSSARQPAGEGWTRRIAIGCVLALAFGWLAWRHGPTLTTLVLSAYAVIFVIIAVIDLDHHLILNVVIAPAALLALAAALVLPDFSLVKALVGAAAGLVIMLLPALIMPGGLGGGDVKLAGFLGLATGFPAILTSLATGIILGGVTTIVLLATRRIGRRDYIPYGPFLLAGAVLAFLRWP
jgi:leader peptidase (prepilin peptidase)/N-methyltransferase